MAELISQAYKAIDGTIFSTQNECELYETQLLKTQAPMYELFYNSQDTNKINPQLQITQDFSKAIFVFLFNDDIKRLFIQLRTNKYELDNQAGRQNSLSQYSVDGIESQFYGMFALRYFPEDKTYKWINIDDYTNYLSTLEEVAQEAKTRAQILYNSKY